MKNLPGIPTVYQGRRYRSRLEARYAAFFDRLAWPFEYEPIDLHGYVPDFIIPGIEPMLVEVKPFVPPFEHEDVVMVCNRITEGGWLGDALVVGAQHRIEYTDVSPMQQPSLLDNGVLRYARPTEQTGMTRVCIGRVRDGDDVWRDAYLGRDYPAFVDDPQHNGSYWFVTHDARDALLNSTDFFTLRTAWGDAGNVTQWKGAR